ncbi:MAG: N,N-dimethylformamidase beta subunit family domain-containing protein [Acidimicrobiales bacterium]
MPTRRERRIERQKRRRRTAIVATAAACVIAVAAAGVASGRLGHSATRHAAALGPQVAPSTARDAAHAHGPPRPTTTAVAAASLAALDGDYGVTAAWVAAENAKPGSGRWKITGAQDPDGIAGYANLVQAEVGQTLALYVSTRAASFHVEAYRMGYYQGLGARLVWSSAQVPGAVQPRCPVAPATNMVQCDWRPSLQVTLTSAWVQGQYLLKLVGSAGEQSYVPLTVWDPSSDATYVIMAGVLTDQAFNSWGGYDLYQGVGSCAPNVYPCSTRSRVVSFDRPYAAGDGAASYLSLLYPLTRFAEQHSLDVTYWTDITLAEQGSLLQKHRVLISPGHVEEGSLEMRQAATSAAEHGVNLIFFGASPILRKVRLEQSPLGADREMVNYRDPAADPLHRSDPAQVSQNWWGQYPASSPASELVGANYVGYYNAGAFPLTVSEPGSWLFAGTGLGTDAQVPGVLSGDFQAYDPALGATPAGVEILAHSRVTITDHPDRRYADTTYYTLPGSRAGVFSSGTVGWIPSLQDCAPKPGCPARIMQQITGNLLRVFGAGPAGAAHPSVANWKQFYG